MTAARLFCFRLDVDTHLGVGQGMTNLLKLANEEADARFTFFANMGRAVSRGTSFRELFSKSEAGRQPEQPTNKFSSRQRLGTSGFLVAALLNPRVGAAHGGQLREAVRSGHEVGLHGGLNHAIWMREAHLWNSQRTSAEIDWGLARLKEAGIESSLGFSSPGWNTPPDCTDILSQRGFSYLADIHDPDRQSISVDHTTGLRLVPTTIVGEPGGIGYVEFLRSQNLDDREILEEFSRQLEGKQLAVVYDHPAYVGRHELEIVCKMFRIARDKGFEIATITEAVQTLSLDD